MSLRFKLSAVIAAISLLMVSTVTAVRTIVRARELEAELTRKAEVYVQMLGRQLEPAVAYDDVQTAREVLESAGSDADVKQIALYAEDGSLIEGSEERPAPWPVAPQKVTTRREPGAIVTAMPIVSAEGPRAVLYLTLSTARMRRQMVHTLQLTAALSFGLLALAMAAAWFIAGLVVRRVAHIAAAADRVARGELTLEPLEPGAADELGRLTVGFNVMLERIRTEQERLAQLVDARTAELSASREQFRQFAETTRAIPFEYDLGEHRFTYVGPQCAGVTGHEAKDWLEPGFLDRTMAPGEYEQALAEVRLQLSRGPQYDQEFRLRATDGRWLHLRASANATGERVRGLLLDVTERRQLEDELQHSQKLESVGRLAAGVAHEINTPVQFSNDSVMFVRDAWADTMTLLDEYRKAGPLEEREQEIDLDYLRENVPKSTDRAIEGLGRIAEIVKSMKAFAQADQVEKVSYDVRQGLETTLIIAKNEYKYVADVETKLGEVPPVVARPGELNQVWLALITNAAQAITDRGPRGKITVEVAARDGKVVVSIADTGCGIPEEVREHIFDQFFTTRVVGKGKGQGLSMSLAVVKRHGGDITFESKVGEGTTFFVTLPEEGCELAKVA